MNILIIEDEKKAATRLSELICSIDDTANIIDTIDSIEAGISWFAENKMPELIFTDIELADGVSFKLFEQVKITCPIIFTTAYNQYMVNAFETNAISYILKPIAREQVEKALEKYQSMCEAFAQNTNSKLQNQQIKSLLKLIDKIEPKRHKSTLIVNVAEKIIPISANDIAYIYATSAGLQITTTKNQVYNYNSTLDELEQVLDDEKFFRASRQFIIARHSIVSIERFFNRTLVVKLQYQTPERVSISRLKVKIFLDWMEAITN